MGWHTGRIALLLLIATSLSIPAFATVNYCGHRLDSVRSFAVYYGSDDSELRKLTRFDLVILSPLIDNESIKYLRDHGVITLGYVSLTTLGGWEPWAASIPPELTVGRIENWNERVMNVCDARWVRVILDEAEPYVLSKGFDGVFLDNLDIVDEYPWMKDCIINLIRMIRDRYPKAVIIVNRGFSIVREIAPYIDAILYEDFGTYYDFKEHKYRKWRGSEYEWMISVAEMLRNLSRTYGVKILALGYADLNNETMLEEYCSYVYTLALKYGFVPYVAGINLDKVNTYCMQLLEVSTCGVCLESSASEYINLSSEVAKASNLSNIAPALVVTLIAVAIALIIAMKHIYRRM